MLGVSMSVNQTPGLNGAFLSLMFYFGSGRPPASLLYMYDSDLITNGSCLFSHSDLTAILSLVAAVAAISVIAVLVACVVIK